MLSSRSIFGKEGALTFYRGASSTLPLGKPPTQNTEVDAEDSNTAPKKVNNGNLRSWLVPQSKWDLLKRLVKGCIIGYATVQTPGLWLALDSALSTDLISVKPHIVAAGEPFPSMLAPSINTDIDNCVEGRPYFPTIARGIHIAGVHDAQLRDLDINQSGTILDTTEEINNLIGILAEALNVSYETGDQEILRDAIDGLEDAKIVHRLLWGDDGLGTNDVFQVDGNCQIASDMLAHAFTYENAQRLKALIEVNEYTTDEFYAQIDAVVSINGRKIEVNGTNTTIQNPYRAWRGAKPERSTPEGPFILSYAIEQELAENYMPNPWGLTSPASSTLLTGENHAMLLVPILSDNSLKNIIRHAPGAIVKAGTYPSFTDYFSRANTMLGGTAFGNEEEGNYTIIPHHEYAVKGLQETDQGIFITLVCTNPNADRQDEVTIPMDTFRSHFMTITARRDQFSAFDDGTLRSYVIAIMLLIAANLSLGRLESRNKQSIEENSEAAIATGTEVL